MGKSNFYDFASFDNVKNISRTVVAESSSKKALAAQYKSISIKRSIKHSTGTKHTH